MVTIYALINPFNNEPFYVGSTNQKRLTSRLSGHLHGQEGTKQKKDLIKLIKSEGLKVEIMPLLVCSEKAAIKCETHIYQLLIKEGYILYQEGNRIQRHNIKYFAQFK